MIYVIINKSHDLDDFSINGTIDFISVSLQNAEKHWNEYYSKMSKMDNSKWNYSAELREYKDDYFIYDFNSSFRILKNVDNCQ